MKLPITWAQSYAPFKATPAEFAERMTMTGSKVEYYENEADNIKNVVIGRVESLVKHEDSDHLWVCAVNTGAETIQIVTGAQNLKEGDVCPVALHGSKLPDGTEIRRGKLRGVESNGMLCSISELGLTLHDCPYAVEDGILVLAEEAELGMPATKALGLDETVFEFEITPNRPDCLSVLGLAREAAATFGVPFSQPQPPEPQGEGNVEDLLKVAVEADDMCLRYSAAMVDNVRIKESPAWLRARLRHAGVRPINNIVDITNYVMLEYGQPMHAFDYAYVNSGKITVRRAKNGESIVTLDDVERKLDENVMVIADEKGAIAVAGVMGGEYSGVYDTTEKVVFECAAFDGPSVRAASRKIGLRTESSTRFEKGLDPNMVTPALRRALQLVKELDAGDIVGGVIDEYPAPRTPREMNVSAEAVSALLGINVTEKQIEETVVPLGFKVDGGKITVPTFRADVSLNCDIAEEVARFIGYDRIPATILNGAAQARPTPRQVFERKCTEILVGCGLWQCQTMSFYSPKSFDMINLPQQSPLRAPVKIMNPLGEETSVMRTTALPSLLEVTARNWAARAESCAVFEQATEYIPDENPELLPAERQKLIICAYGEGWDYLAVKGVAEALLEAAGIESYEVKRNKGEGTYHPGRCADIWVELPDHEEGEGSETVRLATIGEIHPAVCENYDIKTRVVAADISLDALFDARGITPQYKHLPRFPAVTRDLALVMDEEVPAGEVTAIIKNAAGKRLESLTLFDVFTGEKVGEGKKSLAYSLVLRDAEATLTDEDADAITKKVLAGLEKLGAVLRS